MDQFGSSWPHRSRVNSVLRWTGLDIFWRRKSERINATVRQAIQKRLEQTPDLKNAKVSRLVFDAVMDGVDRAVDANRQLESKANGIVVLCVAIIGFGANFLKEIPVHQPVLFGFTFLCLVGSIVCAIGVGSVKTHDLPSVVVYNLPTIVEDDRNESKILVELSESLSSYARDERNAGLVKSKWLFCATPLFLVGFALFAALAWRGIFSQDPSTAASFIGPPDSGL